MSCTNEQNMEGSRRKQDAPDVPDYQTLEYWQPHFSKNCRVSLEYYTVDDGVKILAVKAENINNPDKTPMVLVAGWFSLIYGWTNVTKKVSEETSVIYIETREKNSSIITDFSVDMGVDRMALDVKQVIKQMELNIADAIVLASSMGGTTMFSYLGSRFTAPKATFLIGPNPHFEFPRILVVPGLKLPIPILRLLKNFIAWYIQTFRVDKEKEPEQAAKYENVAKKADTWKLRQSARDCLWYRAWDIFDNIDANVILVGATADKMHKAEATEKIMGSIKNSRFVDFPSNKATHSEDMGKFILEYIETNDIPKKYLKNEE